MYGTQRQPSQEPSQMSHVIDIVRVRSQHKNEQHDYHRYKHQLAFQQPPDNVQALPVQYHVTDDCTNNSVQGCWRACFYNTVRGICQACKNVSPDPWNNKNYQRLPPPKRVLHSAHEYQDCQHVAKKMYEVDVQILCWHQSPYLALLYIRREVSSQVQQHCRLDLQQFPFLIDSYHDFCNVHSKYC